MEFKKKVLLQDGVWSWTIIGLTVLIYAWSLSNGFIWDDYTYLVDNPSMLSLRGLVGFWGPSDAFPLTASSFWIQHKLWGFHPWGFHAVSLTLHILNALLLFGLVRRLVPSLAGVTALLFAIHPIQVETVAWIAEQKNLWCFFFLTIAFHSFLDFCAGGGKKSYAKMIVLFVAALLSKSIAACFAVVPLLYAWWKQGTVSWRDLFYALPLFLIGALSVIVPLYYEGLGSGSELSGLFLSEKLILAGKNFFFYIKQIVLPWQFLTLYPKWGIDATRIENWIFPSAVIALYFVLYQNRQRLGRGAFALLCFYGVSIFPVLGFIKISLLSITSAVDHFSYLAVPPVLLLLGSAGQVASSWFRIPPFRESLMLKRCLAIAAVLFLSSSSFRLTLNYKDDVTLFGELQRQSPGSFFANSRFGIVCLDNPELCSTDRAIEALERAAQIGPDESLTLAKLGVAYERKGLWEQSKQAFWNASIGQDPYSQSCHFYEIGRISMGQSKFPEAVAYLEKSVSLKIHPDYLKHRDRYLRFQKASDLSAEKLASYYLLGQAYFLLQDYKSAAEAFRSAIAVAPHWSKSYQGLGASFVNQGDFPSALEAFREAARLDPENQDARNNLEFARRRLADKEVAI